MVPPTPLAFKLSALFKFKPLALLTLSTDIPAPVSRKNFIGFELFTRTWRTIVLSSNTKGTTARWPFSNWTWDRAGLAEFGFCWPKARFDAASNTPARTIARAEGRRHFGRDATIMRLSGFLNIGSLFRV